MLRMEQKFIISPITGKKYKYPQCFFDKEWEKIKDEFYGGRERNNEKIQEIQKSEKE